MLMLVQIYGDNGVKKTAVYKLVKHFSEGRETVTEKKEMRTGSNKNCNKSLCCIYLAFYFHILTLRLPD